MEDMNVTEYLEAARRMINSLVVTYNQFVEAASNAIHSLQPLWSWASEEENRKKTAYLRRYERRGAKMKNSHKKRTV